MGVGQTLRAELGQPRTRAIAGALAGGAVLLGLRARKRSAGAGAAGAGETSSAQGAPARLVPLGATSSTIPDGYNGTGTDGVQTAVNALAGTTQSLQELIDTLRSSPGGTTATGGSVTPSTPTSTTPATPAPTSAPQSNQLAPWQTLAQGFYRVGGDYFSVIPGQGVHNESFQEIAAHGGAGAYKEVTDPNVGQNLRTFLGQ